MAGGAGDGGTGFDGGPTAEMDAIDAQRERERRRDGVSREDGGLSFLDLPQQKKQENQKEGKQAFF